MRIDNELYSVLSSSTGQTYLLLNELPNMVTMFNNHYQIECSDSYSERLHAMAVNENIPGVMPLELAIQRLMQNGYSLFLLTIGCNTVSFYINSNGLFNVTRMQEMHLVSLKLMEHVFY